MEHYHTENKWDKTGIKGRGILIEGYNMSAKWKKTNFRGVRYHEHPTRKHGVKMDQYFTIRYALGDKANPEDYNIKEEGLGWASQGWTAAKAYDRLRELKENR